MPQSPSDPKRDDIYRQPLEKIESFRFDAQVADVFDDMISRSVPLYAEVQQTAAALAAKLLPTQAVVYDLGCSTGTSLLALCEAIPSPEVRFIGVDTSESMLEICEKKLLAANVLSRVSLMKADIAEIELKNCDMALLNYTLQFIAPDQRQALLRRIYTRMNPGAVLLLTEKVKHENPDLQVALTELYHEFKQRRGYSELEISQKREALENILIPFTADENKTMLENAGFSSIEAYLKWYTFVSFVGLKQP